MTSKKYRKFRITNTMVREGLAEFLGTCILMLFGVGAGAQHVLSGGKLGSVDSTHWAGGIGVMMGIYAAGGVSGGHINPSLTLALAVVGKLQWKKVPVYMISQYLGSFTASVLIFAVYHDALTNFDSGIRQFGGQNDTARIWSTYPQSFASLPTVLADQIFSTALFLILVMAITDNRNMQTPKALIPISIGLIVVGIGMAFHLNCGYAINPARDLAPRIFTAIAGWGAQPFSVRDYQWFWVPVVGPHAGAIVGACAYQLLVGYHWPPEYHVTNVKQEKGHDNNAFELTE